MANRHVRAMRLAALVPIGVVLVLVASATAGTPSSYTFKGQVSAQNDRWDWHQVKVSAGATVSVRLNWWSEDANLQVVVFGPDGTEVAAARDGSVRPKDLSFVATSDGSYNTAVRAESGRSGYKLQVDITPNEAPIATPDSASLVQGTSVSIDPLANDSDPDGDSLALYSVGTPSDGTVVKGTGGKVTYKPKSGFSGSDSFGYTVCDTRNPDKCSSSKVDVSVTSLVATSVTVCAGHRRR